MDYDIVILYKCRKCKMKLEADEYDINIENRHYIYKTCRICRAKYRTKLQTKFNNKIIIDYC